MQEKEATNSVSISASIARVTDKWSCFAGDLLKRSRAQAGLSQRQLAALAGVSNVEVARIESHRVQPSIPTLGRLLDVCGSGVELSGRYVDNRVDTITASRAIRERLAQHDEDGAYRNWLVLLDDLEAVSAVRLTELVHSPAAPTGDSRYDALIAALVEYVCGLKAVEPPGWVTDPWRMTTDWYVSGILALRELERDESPASFSNRGIYICQADLTHV